MVQHALERLGKLTRARYEIYMTAGELLKIARRNEGLVEWAKFTVRDSLIGLYCFHFRTVNASTILKESTSSVIVSIDTRNVGVTAQWFFICISRFPLLEEVDLRRRSDTWRSIEYF
jgi:hypothetical protein